MDNMFNLVPPIIAKNEPEVFDDSFERACEAHLEMMFAHDIKTKFGQKKITKNSKFGIVCRLKFKTPDDSKNYQNIVVLWLRSNGEIAEFVGFDVPKSDTIV